MNLEHTQKQLIDLALAHLINDVSKTLDGLELNINKPNIIHLKTLPKTDLLCTEFKINLLMEKYKIGFLEVLIDQHLNWKTHINALATKN